MNRLLLVGLVAGLATWVSAEVRTVTWTGAENGYWTNANNWAEGVVPGIYVHPDGTYESGEDTEDQVVFGPVTAGAVTTINLDGHRCVSNLFLTAGAPAYTFGASASQQLGVRMGGLLNVAEGVTADQTIAAKAFLGYWDMAVGSQRGAGQHFHICNNGTGTLIFAGNVKGNYNCYFHWQGTGDIWLQNSFETGSQSYHEMDGTLICSQTQLSGSSYFKSMVTQYRDLHKIRLPNTDSRFNMNDWGAPFQPSFSANTLVDGEGIFTINNSGPANGSEGRTGVGIKVYPETTTMTVKTRLAFITKTETVYVVLPGSGTFNPQRTLEGAHRELRIGSGKLLVSKIGCMGCDTSDTLVGTNVASVLFEGAGALIYNGTGETTDRGLGFRTTLTTGTVRNAGTGTLTLSGAVTSAVNNATLALDAATAPIVFTGTVQTTPRTTKLALVGAAGHQLGTGAQDFSAVALSGAQVTFAGDLSLPSTTVKSGASTMTLAAGQTVTLAGLAFEGGGTLDVKTTDATAKIKVLGVSAGDAPGSLTINGKIAQFANDGTVEKRTVAVNTEISAYGGRIPNDATKNVGVTTDGNPADGPILLASGTAAAVGALAQKTAADATVALGAGETLTTGKLFAGEGAGALTIGASVGQGNLVAASGIFSFWPETAANLIVVKAAANFAAATSIVKDGAGTVRLEGGLDYGKTITVSEGELAAKITAAQQNFTLAGAGTFAKEGTGSFVVPSGRNTSFMGDYVVCEGTVAPGAADCKTIFGAENGGRLVVSNTAALRTYESSASTVNFGSKRVCLAGTGPDGKGALVFQPANKVELSIGKLALLGDTTIHAPDVAARVLRVTQELDMGGHALTRTGGNRFYLGPGNNCVVTNPGPIYLVGPDGNGGNEDYNSFLVFCAGLTFPNGAPHVYVTNANTRIIMNLSGEVPCPISITNSLCTFGVFGQVDGPHDQRLTGPIDLVGESANLNVYGYNDGSRLIGFMGPISGTGGVTTRSAGNILLAGTNTFTGTLNYGAALGSGASSRLTFARPESLPAVDRLVISGYGSVNVPLKKEGTDTGWTLEQIGQLLVDFKYKSNAILLGVDISALGDTTLRTTQLPDLPVDDYNHNFGAGMLRTCDATNTLTLAIDRDWGVRSSTYGTRNGQLRITGDGQHWLTGSGLLISGDCSFSTGRVEICGNANVRFMNSSSVACNDGTSSYLGINHATVRGPEASYTMLYLASCTKAQGVLEIGEGADIEGVGFVVGSGMNATAGIVWQDGGSFRVTKSQCVLGQNTGGFYGMTDGLLSFSGEANLTGPSGTNAHMLVYQSGGRIFHDSQNPLTGGRESSYTHLYLTGGETEIGGVGQEGLYLPVSGKNIASYTNGQGVVTVAGPTAHFAVTNTKRIVLAAQKNAFAAVNINAGVFEAGSIQVNPDGAANARAVLSLNGGTLRVNKDTSAFAVGSDLTCLLGPNGGTVDTAGHDVTLGKPFVRATGGVVTAIPFGPVNNVLAPYSVRIEGDGVGATAVVNYDRATRTMTGVTVTSGGTGYTWAKAIIYSGANKLTYGKRYDVDCTVSTASTAASVLRKAGEGTLHLGAAALPADTVLDVVGGTLDLAGYDVTGGGITVHGTGTVTNSAGALILPGVLTIDVPTAAAGNYLTLAGEQVTLPTTIALQRVDQIDARTKSFTILKVVGSTPPAAVPAVTEDLPPAWQLYWVGNTLKLGVPRGMHLNFR